MRTLGVWRLGLWATVRGLEGGRLGGGVLGVRPVKGAVLAEGLRYERT